MKFDLAKMGWKDFQKLCALVLRESFSQSAMTFAEVNDAGMDIVFEGLWTPINGESISGATVVQCKHTSLQKTFKPSDLADDIRKLSILAADGLVENYVLMTNAEITGSSFKKMRKSVKAAGAKEFYAFSQSWFDQALSVNKKLRMLVPRLYGLGDLSQILDERAYAQAHSLLKSMSGDISKVVLTGTYSDAFTRLTNDGVVMLVGEATAGKSTIAACLSLALIDKEGASPIKLPSLADFKRLWNPNEPTQVFWFDDVFGATQYDSTLAALWDNLLPEIRAAVRAGAKIILTSRDYIYEQALTDLKRKGIRWLEERSMVINVKALTLSEKQQITYNHLKLGNQDKSFLIRVKPFLEAFAANPAFLPETARRLGNREFTEDLNISTWSLKQFVEEPQMLLADTVEEMSEELRLTLFLIFVSGSRLRTADIYAYTDMLTFLGLSAAKAIQSLSFLNGSFVSKVNDVDSPYWTFKHPTVKDAMRELTSVDSALLMAFIKFAPISIVCNELTVNVRSYGGELPLPEEFHEELLERLVDDFSTGLTAIVTFLARSVDDNFVLSFMDLEPSYQFIIDASKSISKRLAFRLYRLKQLPEDTRVEKVKAASESVLQLINFETYTDDEVGALYTREEFELLNSQVRQQIFGEYDEWLSEFTDDYQIDEEPDEYISQVSKYLRCLEDHFAEDGLVLDRLSTLEDSLYDWVQYAEIKYSFELEEMRNPSYIVNDSEAIESDLATTKSVFDDVDEIEGVRRQTEAPKRKKLKSQELTKHHH